MRLRAGDAEVASYVVSPAVQPRHGPRPYLHPVRTLAGVTVTDAGPDDHPWHLGVSVAMQDVAGANLWGGRTYVRDQGYTWRDDHGVIVHDGFDAVTSDGFAERLRWLAPGGAPLLNESRSVAVSPAGPGWELDFSYRLAGFGQDVALGSPATNGRPGGAGYGGFFWRAAPGASFVFDAAGARGEDAVNGSVAPWIAFGGPAYTLVLTGLADEDRWFVRTGIYPGVCAALAFERPLVVPAGGAVDRRLRVLVADGALGPAQVEAYCRDEVRGNRDPGRQDRHRHRGAGGGGRGAGER